MRPSAGLFFAFGLSFFLGVDAEPSVRRDTLLLQNGEDAESLNAKFKTLSLTSPCTPDEVVCVNDQLARCAQGYLKLIPCNAGLVCRALPKTDSLGTTIGCVAENKDAIRILARGDHTARQDDPSQTSLCLDPAVLSTGFENDGQSNITTPGQVASKTSSNNWINFCKTVNKPLTNGTQIQGGSCNPAPIGVLPSIDNIPSTKFIFPPNFEVLAKGKSFTIQIAINHLETGWFTNPDLAYLAAPTMVNSAGDVLGHSHVVIEQLTGFGQTVPTVPKTFVFFKGVNTAAVNGVLSTDVTGGLPAGYYRIAVLATGANHQPIAPPVAQAGSMGDMVYFSVI